MSSFALIEELESNLPPRTLPGALFLQNGHEPGGEMSETEPLVPAENHAAPPPDEASEQRSKTTARAFLWGALFVLLMIPILYLGLHLGADSSSQPSRVFAGVIGAAGAAWIARAGRHRWRILTTVLALLVALLPAFAVGFVVAQSVISEIAPVPHQDFGPHYGWGYSVGTFASVLAALPITYLIGRVLHWRELVMEKRG